MCELQATLQVDCKLQTQRVDLSASRIKQGLSHDDSDTGQDSPQPRLWFDRVHLAVDWCTCVCMRVSRLVCPRWFVINSIYWVAFRCVCRRVRHWGTLGHCPMIGLDLVPVVCGISRWFPFCSLIIKKSHCILSSDCYCFFCEHPAEPRSSPKIHFSKTLIFL